MLSNQTNRRELSPTPSSVHKETFMGETKAKVKSYELILSNTTNQQNKR